MAATAAILGLLGAVSGILGIVGAAGVLELDFVPKTFTPMMFMATAVVLLLGTIACAVSARRSGGPKD